jgi:hypothetical protein
MFSVALATVAVCLFTVGSASAGVTIDLIWADGSGTALTVSAGDTGNNGCDGFFNSTAGRCMLVVWTVDADGLFVGSNSVGWSNLSGISATHAAFFPQFKNIPVGKASDPWGPFPSAHFPTNGINNPAARITAFTGAVQTAGATPSVTYLGAGTYQVGTIVWDVSGASAGTHIIAPFLESGIDGFLDSTNAQTNAPVLNAATLNVVPEPGTASLLGLGLLGLLVASRRRNA